MDEDLMAIEKRWAETMQGCAPGACLEAEALLELAERGKRSRDYAARIAHVAVCRNCRESFKLLQRVEVARPRPALGWLAQPRTGFAMAAVAAAALAIFFISQNSVSPSGKRQAPIAGNSNGGVVKPNPEAPKDIVDRAKLQQVARLDSSAPKPTRILTPRKRMNRGSHKPVTPERDPNEIPKGSMLAEATGQPGILEGEVVYTMILEGEVGRSDVLQGEVTPGPTVKGQVVPKSPPPLELR